MLELVLQINEDNRHVEETLDKHGAVASLYSLGEALASIPPERRACIDAANRIANKCMGYNPTREQQINCSSVQSHEIEECNKIGEIKDVTVPRKTENPLFGKTDPSLAQRAEGKNKVRVTLANPRSRDAVLEAFAGKKGGQGKGKKTYIG